jgi:hypothetical protein
MRAESVALISSSRLTVHTFLEEATTLGIRVPHILEFENHKKSSENLPKKVEKFLKRLPGRKPIVVVIVEAVEAVAIAEYLKHARFVFVFFF